MTPTNVRLEVAAGAQCHEDPRAGDRDVRRLIEERGRAIALSHRRVPAARDRADHAGAVDPADAPKGFVSAARHVAKPEITHEQAPVGVEREARHVGELRGDVGCALSRGARRRARRERLGRYPRARRSFGSACT